MNFDSAFNQRKFDDLTQIRTKAIGESQSLEVPGLRAAPVCQRRGTIKNGTCDRLVDK